MTKKEAVIKANESFLEGESPALRFFIFQIETSMYS